MSTPTIHFNQRRLAASAVADAMADRSAVAEAMADRPVPHSRLTSHVRRA